MQQGPAGPLGPSGAQGKDGEPGVMGDPGDDGGVGSQVYFMGLLCWWSIKAASCHFMGNSVELAFSLFVSFPCACFEINILTVLLNKGRVFSPCNESKIIT